MTTLAWRRARWHHSRMGYGKHYSTMYSGSMFGCGAINFALMGFVLSNFRASKEHGATVELNPRMLAAIFGEPVKEIDKAIAFLCAADSESRTKTEDGRRLVRLGEFEFRVVNGAKYRAQRDEDNRRDQNRVNQSLHRFKKRGASSASVAEYEAALKRGASEDELDAIITRSLPVSHR